VDSYRPLEYQVFVLRFWRESTSGTWRGQIVHLPDQETTSFASWDQAQEFVDQFVMDAQRGIGNLADDDGSGPPA
jgi:hypothetical protein